MRTWSITRWTFPSLHLFLMGMTDKAMVLKKGNLQPNVALFARFPPEADQSQWVVKQALDIGLHGVIFNGVDTREQALIAVKSMRYPQLKGSKYYEPNGTRGAGPANATWIWGISGEEYDRHADLWPLNPEGDLLAIVMIESVEGLQNLDRHRVHAGRRRAIRRRRQRSDALDGRSSRFAGSRGGLQKVLSACKAHKIGCAITANTANDVAKRVKEGWNIIRSTVPAINEGRALFWEKSNEIDNVRRIVLIAFIVVVGVVGKQFSQAAPPRQAAACRSSKSIARGRRYRPNGSWRSIEHRHRCARQRVGSSSPPDPKPEQASMAAPPVIVFDSAGNYVKAWGGASNGYEWPEREHGIHIDYKGFVWLGGNNCPTNGLPGLKPLADDQLLKFTQDGKFVMQVGRSNQSEGDADTRNLHRPADQWVHPQTNELFVADGYGNHRIAVFDADSGAFKRMWGAFGNKPVDDDHCEVVTPASFSDPGPPQLSIVHAIRVARDGTVYVADREYRRVQMFTKDGKFLKQLVRNDAPFARDLALSPDAAQQFLYVGGGNGIFIVDRKTLEIVGDIQPEGIIGSGHQIAVDSKGNLYIARPPPECRS